MSKITTTEIINGLYSRSGTLCIADQIKMADDNESATISEVISNLNDRITDLNGVFYYSLNNFEIIPDDGVYHFDGSENLDSELSCVNGVFGFFSENSGYYYFKPIGGSIEYYLEKIGNVWSFESSVPNKYSINKENLFVNIDGSSSINVNSITNGWELSVKNSGITSDMLSSSLKNNILGYEIATSAVTNITGSKFSYFEYSGLVQNWFNENEPTFTGLTSQFVVYFSAKMLDTYPLENIITLDCTAGEGYPRTNNSGFIIDTKSNTIVKNCTNNTEGTNWSISLINLLNDKKNIIDHNEVIYVIFVPDPTRNNINDITVTQSGLIKKPSYLEIFNKLNT